MALMDLRVWMGIAIAVLVGLLGLQQVRVSMAKANTAEAKAEFARYVTTAEQKARQAEQDARRLEQAWQNNANMKGAQKDAEIQVLRERADVLSGELRKRPSRPSTDSNVPPVAGVAQGCTGASLYAEDATAALREAQRADELRIGLQACYSTYDAIRDSQVK